MKAGKSRLSPLLHFLSPEIYSHLALPKSLTTVLFTLLIHVSKLPESEFNLTKYKAELTYFFLYTQSCLYFPNFLFACRCVSVVLTIFALIHSHLAL